VGSGVIYRSNGIILTNEHVVRGHRAVNIAFADGQREPGQVTAADPDTDLALVRVERNGLPAQTAAPISPGNSGGAVVDGQEKVIGISEAYIPPEAGAVAIGFAIPAATAVNVADQLLKTGRVEHAFIGIQPAQLTPQLAQELGIRETSGILVYGVTPGGPAEQAHIAPGDILVALAGKQLTSVEDMFTALRPKRPGEAVTLELVRGGKRQRVDVRLSDKPQ
jgi:S1-C subfamily serine protease